MSGDVVSATLTADNACQTAALAVSGNVVITVENSVNYFADVDGDGFGDPTIAQLTCPQPVGFVTDNTDCDDTNAAINPSILEICDNGIDENCVLSDDLCAVSGCTNPIACNFNPLASTDDGSCVLPVDPSVILTQDVDNVCQGTPITFTASVSNEGSNPTYEWFINGIAQGVNSLTFVSSSLAAGDQVSFDFIPDNPCQSTSLVQEVVTPAIITAIVPSITVVADVNNICTGATVNFTATPIILARVHLLINGK